MSDWIDQLNREEEREQQPEQAPSPPPDLWPTVKLKGRKPKCGELMRDQGVWRQLLETIRQGAYDYVVAEAMGISDGTFYRWMRQGEQDYHDGRHTNERKFWREVRQAKARARMDKELEVARVDPKFWLKNVAKTKEGRPGWTDEVQVSGDIDVNMDLGLSGLIVKDDAPASDLAAVFVLMEQLRLLVPTPVTRNVVESSQVVEGSATVSEPINDQPEDDDYDDDEEDEIGGRGYFPEKGKHYKDVPAQHDTPFPDQPG